MDQNCIFIETIRTRTSKNNEYSQRTQNIFVTVPVNLPEKACNLTTDFFLGKLCKRLSKTYKN